MNWFQDTFIWKMFHSSHHVEQVAQHASGMWGFLLTVILVFAIVGFIFFLPFLIKKMAEKDFLFTLVKEGSAKAIMSGGGFQKFVWQFSGKTINDKGNVVKATNEESGKEKWKKRFGLSGIKFLGIPGLHTIHKYRFRWNSLKQSEDEGTLNNGGIYYTPHDEEIDYILLQDDVYYARIEEAEDSDFVPLNFDITLRIRVTNPYKALFKAQEWLEMVWGLIIPSWRNYVATQTWETLAERSKECGGSFNDIIKAEIKQIKNTFGVCIDEFKILRIKPGGARADMYEEAATKEYEAKQEAKRIRIAAEAEKDRINKVYGEVEKAGELGKLIRRLEALERVGEKGNTIISAPDLSGAVIGAVEAFKKMTKK